MANYSFNTVSIICDPVLIHKKLRPIVEYLAMQSSDRPEDVLETFREVQSPDGAVVGVELTGWVRRGIYMVDGLFKLLPEAKILHTYMDEGYFYGGATLKSNGKVLAQCDLEQLSDYLSKDMYENISDLIGMIREDINQEMLGVADSKYKIKINEPLSYPQHKIKIDNIVKFAVLSRDSQLLNNLLNGAINENGAINAYIRDPKNIISLLECATPANVFLSKDHTFENPLKNPSKFIKPLSIINSIHGDFSDKQQLEILQLAKNRSLESIAYWGLFFNDLEMALDVAEFKIHLARSNQESEIQILKMMNTQTAKNYVLKAINSIPGFYLDADDVKKVTNNINLYYELGLVNPAVLEIFDFKDNVEYQPINAAIEAILIKSDLSHKITKKSVGKKL